METNSAWFNGLESATAVLASLKSAGLEALLVAISPFHKAHIPFNRVRGVLEACRQTGIRRLYVHARQEHAFEPAESGYVGKCDLCNAIRRCLFNQDPAGYYR